MNNDVKVSDMDNILFKDEIIPETKVRVKAMFDEENPIYCHKDCPNLMWGDYGVVTGCKLKDNIIKYFWNDHLDTERNSYLRTDFCVDYFNDLTEEENNIRKTKLINIKQEYDAMSKKSAEKVRAEREKLDINNEKSKQYKIKKKEELQKLVNDISDADIKMIKDEIEKVIVDTNNKLERSKIEDFILHVYIANHYPDLSNTSAKVVYYMLRKKIKE